MFLGHFFFFTLRDKHVSRINLFGNRGRLNSDLSLKELVLLKAMLHEYSACPVPELDGLCIFPSWTLFAFLLYLFLRR